MGWVVSATPRPIYSREKPVLFVQEARWARGPSGRVRKISPPPTGSRSPDRPARSKSQYRLSCTGPPTKAVTHYTAKLETEFQISWIPESPPLITKIATVQSLKANSIRSHFSNFRISCQILLVPSCGRIPGGFPNKILNIFYFLHIRFELGCTQTKTCCIGARAVA